MVLDAGQKFSSFPEYEKFLLPMVVWVGMQLTVLTWTTFLHINQAYSQMVGNMDTESRRLSDVLPVSSDHGQLD